MKVEHIAGETFHGRKGAVGNSFRYGVDYLLLDPDAVEGPSLLSKNRGNLISVHETDYGGAPGQGRGTAWVREVLAAHAMPGSDRILLLTQPRVLGHVFNPVSFWLCHDDCGELRTVIAEVSNTFGDRHWYLCAKENGAPITREDTLEATKIMHVSPFQPIEGGYRFRFDIAPGRVGIWIDFSFQGGGLYATLTGKRVPLTNRAILRACLRRPFGSRRVLALIHWQALKLALKGARYRSRPTPPAQDVTR
ncbi:hypothetical protein SAMN05878503_10236 [Cereibacter ovatus]|uniref:DUF1365 domain-containing protein n=1 Tax=Cereibacter ovatus TaxID=439529 RepID=A0A285CLH7_9RHOB|nr:DUF1365 domain-containing protein [Cereibacter ovatus]SNX68265.1 hypothetical protein SAMN05878503_10236 [Cereibacter ovatus]